jgi:hypothetical protein
MVLGPMFLHLTADGDDLVTKEGGTDCHNVPPSSFHVSRRYYHDKALVILRINGTVGVIHGTHSLPAQLIFHLAVEQTDVG